MSTRQTPPLSCAGDIAADRPLLSCKGSVLTIVSQLWHCIGLKLAKTWSPRPIVAERAKRKCEHVPQLVRVASKAHIVQWTVLAVINWAVIVNFEMSLCYLSSKSVHINRGLENTLINTELPSTHPMRPRKYNKRRNRSKFAVTDKCQWFAMFEQCSQLTVASVHKCS